MSRTERGEVRSLERELRARSGDPSATLSAAILAQIASDSGEWRRRGLVRLGAAVALTAAAVLALTLAGGSGFAAYSAHQLARAVDVSSAAKRVATSHAAKALQSAQPANTPPGHQYNVVCGAHSSSPCVASIGPNTSVSEAKNRSVVVTLRVSLNAPSDGTATIGYSTASVLGTTPGVDFASASGTLTIGSGKTSAPLALTVLSDGDASTKTLHGETFKVHITPVTGVTIGTADATITITKS